MSSALAGRILNHGTTKEGNPSTNIVCDKELKNFEGLCLALSWTSSGVIHRFYIKVICERMILCNKLFSEIQKDVLILPSPEYSAQVKFYIFSKATAVHSIFYVRLKP